MRFASACTSLVGLLGLTGCGDDASTADAALDASVDAALPRWWQPAPGEARNWDIQLAAPHDLGPTRTMVVLDLWALVPAPTTLEYAEGEPVTVPAGALAGTIAQLHARTPATVVICRVDTGALELDRPDAAKFPGFEASPPDRPDEPSPGSVIGWSTAVPGERYLDIREASRGLFAALIWKRLDLAVQIGCDGILPDRNDMAASDPGFAVTVADEGSWYREVATQAHQRELSVGMKDGNTIPGLIDDLAPDFDWMLVRRCAEYQDCDTTRPFINLAKAVLAIDFPPDGEGGGVDPEIACPRQHVAMIQDGLVKDEALSSAFRVQCTP